MLSLIGRPKYILEMLSLARRLLNINIRVWIWLNGSDQLQTLAAELEVLFHPNLLISDLYSHSLTVCARSHALLPSSAPLVQRASKCLQQLLS